MVRYTAVSSANRRTWVIIYSWRLLIYTRNRIGPRAEPCEPAPSPPTTPFWDLFPRKAPTQTRTLDPTPYWCWILKLMRHCWRVNGPLIKWIPQIFGPTGLDSGVSVWGWGEGWGWKLIGTHHYIHILVCSTVSVTILSLWFNDVVPADLDEGFILFYCYYYYFIFLLLLCCCCFVFFFKKMTTTFYCQISPDSSSFSVSRSFKVECNISCKYILE